MAAESPDDERTGLLADYFRDWEEALGRAVASFEEHERKAILDTWVQFVPDEGLEQDLASLRRARQEGANALVRETFNVQERIGALLKRLAEEMEAPNVALVLAELSEFEQGVEGKLGQAETEAYDA